MMGPNEIETSPLNPETLKLLKCVKQGGQILWYFNQNQIQKMKIKKGEFKIKQTKTSDVMKHVKNVIEPFEPQVTANSITVLLHNECPENLVLATDWDMFEFILFNLVQNSIKFNVIQGFLLIYLKLKENKQKQTELQVRIVDTGLGIEKQRQTLLFTPFKQLNHEQCLS